MSDKKRKIKEFMNSSPEQLRQQVEISDKKIKEKKHKKSDIQESEHKEKTKQQKIMEFLNTDEKD